MKKLITNYTFTPASKQITFNDYSSISLASVLLVTDVTNNTLLYNFANPAIGGTVSTNVLTLDYDTTALSPSTVLQVFYDDPANQPATVANQSELNNLAQGIYDLVDLLAFLPNIRGTNGELRVNLVSTASVATTSSSSMGNIVLFGGQSGGAFMQNQLNQTTVQSNINNCIVS